MSSLPRASVMVRSADVVSAETRELQKIPISNPINVNDNLFLIMRSPYLMEIKFD